MSTEIQDTYHHGDLANALLAAVDEIVRERGVADLSLREAARRAGVSHSAPAHHFGDKHGLLAAFAKEGFDGLVAEMTGVAEREDVPEMMAAMGARYVRFAVAHPAHYDVMFRSGLDKSSDPNLAESAAAAFQGLVDMVARVKDAGYFPDIPADHLAAYFWSMVHGLASLWIDGSLPQVYDGIDLDDLIAGVLRESFAERERP